MRRNKKDKEALKKQFPNVWNYKGWYYTKKVRGIDGTCYFIVSIGDRVYSEEFTTEGECKSFIDKTRDKFNKSFNAEHNERMRKINEENRKADRERTYSPAKLEALRLHNIGLLASMTAQDIRELADITLENVKRSFESETLNSEDKK